MEGSHLLFFLSVSFEGNTFFLSFTYFPILTVHLETIITQAIRIVSDYYYYYNPILYYSNLNRCHNFSSAVVLRLKYKKQTSQHIPNAHTFTQSYLASISFKYF